MDLEVQIYRYLLQQKVPMTSWDIANQAEFRDVKSRSLYRELHNLCEWGMVKTHVDDKGYEKYQAVRRTPENYIDNLGNVEFDPTSWESDYFSICFPKGAMVWKDPKGDCTLRAECVIDDGDVSGKIIMRVNTSNQSHSNSVHPSTRIVHPSTRAHRFAEALLAAFSDIDKDSGDADEPEIFRWINVDAAFVLSYPTTHIHIATPRGEGEHSILRIDWELDCLPPAELARKLIHDWLKTYRIIGKAKFDIPPMPTYFRVGEKPHFTYSLEELISKTSEIGGAVARDLPPERKIQMCRKLLAHTAGVVDEYVVEFLKLEAVHWVPSYELRECGMRLSQTCASIRTEIPLTGNEMHTVHIAPAHAMELLKRITLDRVNAEKLFLSLSEKEELLRFYHKQLPILSQAEPGENLYPDFVAKANAISFFGIKASESGREILMQEYAPRYAQWENAYARWKKENAQNLELQASELAAELAKAREPLDQEVEAMNRRLEAEITKESSCKAQKAEAEERLSGLGFFSFGEKSALREKIRSLDADIASTKKEITRLLALKENECNKRKKEMEELEPRLRMRLGFKYPVSPQPEKPPHPLADEMLKEEMLERMRTEDRPMTITEIHHIWFKKADIGVGHLLNLMRELCGEGRAKLVIERRVGYYVVSDRKFGDK